MKYTIYCETQPLTRECAHVRSAVSGAPVRLERMSAWDAVWGQDEAVAMLRAAAEPDAAARGSMTHAWLITGPAGSGRSTLATAFAAALIAKSPDDTATIAQVQARTHPDLTALRTDRVIISIQEARDLVRGAYYAPSLGRHRVIVVEDADRMTERTSNVLLKALEEPPERTVWVLCAPSEADLLPTIRSRVRTVRLSEPEVDDVARLIVQRTGVDLALAEQSARHAQRHIGMAQRLATDADARTRRDTTVRAALEVRSVSDAVEAAGRIVAIATEDAKALTADRDVAEREQMRRSMGLAEGAAVPPTFRSQLNALEDDQKRRATRSLRDGIDRVLTDLQSLFRDMIMVQYGRTDSLINEELREDLTAVASGWGPARTLAALDAITDTRRSLEQNAAPLLAVESMLVTVASGRKP